MSEYTDIAFWQVVTAKLDEQAKDLNEKGAHQAAIALTCMSIAIKDARLMKLAEREATLNESLKAMGAQ